MAAEKQLVEANAKARQFGSLFLSVIVHTRIDGLSKSTFILSLLSFRSCRAYYKICLAERFIDKCTVKKKDWTSLSCTFYYVFNSIKNFFEIFSVDPIPSKLFLVHVW